MGMGISGGAAVPAFEADQDAPRGLEKILGGLPRNLSSAAEPVASAQSSVSGLGEGRSGSAPLPASATPPVRPPQPTYQQPLFREGGNNKVVAIPTMTPLRPQIRESQTPRAPRMQSSRPRRSGILARPQQEFQFGGEPDLTASSDVICCDVPVALPAHRMMAAAVDASLVLIGAGIFLAVFLFSGHEMELDRQTIPLLVGVVTVLALFYRILWFIADGDTPGMRFAGLRLVDFDGRRPSREMRGLRQAAGLLSIFSVGLGLVWALVDEENLTWHDHISKTFPTAG
jgi:uncharacterized RDD family membrane protein YckC